MARPYTAQELISELQTWIRTPTDPSLRKLLRKTVQTLQAFSELVGEPEPQVVIHTFEQPALVERIKDAE